VGEALTLVPPGGGLGALVVALQVVQHQVDLASDQDLAVEVEVEGLVGGLDLETDLVQGIHGEAMPKGGLRAFGHVGHPGTCMSQLPLHSSHGLLGHDLLEH
jgi:hypothetical protein